MKNDVYLGTELKLKIYVEPIDNITLDRCDFTVECFCSPKQSITIHKSDAIRIDKDNYVVLVDTNAIGVGTLRCKLIAQVPDADFDDLKRTDVSLINTGINIIKV